MEIFGNFVFRILKHKSSDSWYYELFNADANVLIKQSKERFESPGTAKYAAIGHITVIEAELSKIQSEHS